MRNFPRSHMLSFYSARALHLQILTENRQALKARKAALAQRILALYHADQKERDANPPVYLNIGGRLAYTSTSTMMQEKESMLARILQPYWQNRLLYDR